MLRSGRVRVLCLGSEHACLKHRSQESPVARMARAQCLDPALDHGSGERATRSDNKRIAERPFGSKPRPPQRLDLPSERQQAGPSRIR